MNTTTTIERDGLTDRQMDRQTDLIVKLFSDGGP